MQVGPEADAESLSWVDENVQDDSHESILIDLATVYPYVLFFFRKTYIYNLI